MPLVAHTRSVENRKGANEANQTRSENEADARPAEQTDAPVVHIERPIGPVEESIWRFHLFPLDFFLSDQNFRQIDFDLPGWIVLVGRHIHLFTQHEVFRP